MFYILVLLIVALEIEQLPLGLDLKLSGLSLVFKRLDFPLVDHLVYLLFHVLIQLGLRTLEHFFNAGSPPLPHEVVMERFGVLLNFDLFGRKLLRHNFLSLPIIQVIIINTLVRWCVTDPDLLA